MKDTYIQVEYHDQILTVEKPVQRVIDLLKHLNLNPEEVLVFRGEEVLTEDEPLHKGDRLFILEVVSRG